MMMRSRADLMHLDFITGEGNMLRYHSCYLLREMEDSHTIQLSRIQLVFHLFLVFFVGSPSIFLSFFLFCYSNNFVFISSLDSEVLCVYAKSMFGILVETEVKIEVLLSTLASSLPHLDDSLPPCSPLSLCRESFFFLSHASLLPRKSQS